MCDTIIDGYFEMLKAKLIRSTRRRVYGKGPEGKCSAI